LRWQLGSIDLIAAYKFVLPLPIAPFTLSLLWHSRSDGDAAHRWLRGCVLDAIAVSRDEQG
jgi:DNA-binding transcriptional LysR family regulator